MRILCNQRLSLAGGLAWMFVISLFILAGCSSSDDVASSATATNANSNIAEANSVVHRLEFPRVKGGESLVVTHFDNGEVNYSVEWDTVKRSCRWSCYELYASNLVSNVGRYYAGDGEDQYPADPDLHCSTAWTPGNDPFWGSHYDHGHMCPSADRLNSFASNYQTFYLTNMMPQMNGFNAKVWANMESWVRGQIRNQISAETNLGSPDTLYVVKGGTIDNADQVLDTKVHGMIIPKYYFMALLMKNSSGYKAMGFWIEHKASNDTGNALAKYVVNIDTLEQLTGIDFFCNLPDDTENHVEGLARNNVLRAWGFPQVDFAYGTTN